MDDLELNRFRKQGGRVLLEQHSHCEVPAGCGGVVLRWVRPDAPMAVSVRVFSHANPVVRLDGTEAERMVLAVGPHVLGVTLYGVREPEDATLLAEVVPQHRKRSCIVAPLERWQCRWTRPAGGWDRVDASDEGWLPAGRAPVPKPLGEFDEYLLEGFLAHGVVPVGPADSTVAGVDESVGVGGDEARTVWYRLRFDVEAGS